MRWVLLLHLEMTGETKGWVFKWVFNIFPQLVRLESELGLWRKSACIRNLAPPLHTAGLEAGFLTSQNVSFLVYKSSAIITDRHREDSDGRGRGGSIHRRKRQDSANWRPHYYSSLFLLMLSPTDVEVTKFLAPNQIIKIKSGVWWIPVSDTKRTSR